MSWRRTSRSMSCLPNGTVNRCSISRRGANLWYAPELYAPQSSSQLTLLIQIVISILCTAIFFTRRRNFPIFDRRKQGFYDSHLESDDSGSSDDPLWYDLENDGDAQDYASASKHQPKRRTCCGCAIYTPNTSRFSDHVHSRILQKFPFLVEMFYWIITYLFYRLTKVVSNEIFNKSIIDVAQAHGLYVLEVEQFSWINFLFPWKEYDVQHWFMEGHQDALTLLNRFYALMHIPATVG